MRRLVRISILLVFVLTLGSPNSMITKSQATDLPDNASLTQSRLVVFEAFMRPG